MPRETTKRRQVQSTEAGHRGGAVRSRDEGSVMELDRRGCIVQPRPRANRQREEPEDEATPFLAAMPWKRLNIGSRMNREVHVRFWERPEVRLLRATRQTRRFRRRQTSVGSSYECRRADAPRSCQWWIDPLLPVQSTKPEG